MATRTMYESLEVTERVGQRTFCENRFLEREDKVKGTPQHGRKGIRFAEPESLIILCSRLYLAHPYVGAGMSLKKSALSGPNLFTQ